MDSIFEEDADEVGGETEAYCPSPRCKADTTHTIISMYEDEVRRVQCVVCGEVHAYRKPRGDGTEDGAGEGGKKSGPRRLTWDEAMARASDNELANCRPYSIRDSYEEGDVVLHPTFDIGFVVEILPDNCVAMVFRGVPEPKKFIHNRGVEFAARMPDIAEVPVPREQKKKKRARKAEPAAPVPARSKAEVENAVLRARAAAQARMEEAARTADERSKKLKADSKKAKGKAAPAPAKPIAAKAAAKPAAKKPAAPAKKAPPKAAAKGAKKPPAKKKSAAKKPAAKKPAAKKPAAKKPAAKKGKKK